MRARSGAIHSDSEESFTRLAEISINQTGIFYDDKINTRIFTQNKRNNKHTPKATSLRPKQREGEQNKQKNLFTEFDFNIEFEAIRQQREQIERMKEQPRKEVNIGILTSDPEEIVRHLCLIFGLTVEKQNILRGLNLIVNIVHLTTYKYWVFHKQSVESPENPLLELYLTRCSLLVDVLAHQQVNVIRHNMGVSQIESTLLSHLIY